MDILIFGGGHSFIEYYNFCMDYWKETKICAILDNDKEKWRGQIYDIEIISPMYIYQYKYDVILICSLYENEIRKQLIYELCIEEEKIENRRHFFDKVIFPWYKKKYEHKSMLIVGERFVFDILHQLYVEFFKVVGFVDLDEIEMVNNYDYDYILLTKHDRKTNDEIIEQVVDSGYVKREKLLTDDIFQIYRNHIEKFSNGEKYPNKKFLVSCCGYAAGLGDACFRIIHNVLYAKQNGYIPIVDMKTYKNQYLEEDEYGIVNAWEKFFLQPEEYTLEDIKDAKHIFRVWIEVKWGSGFTKEIQPWFPKMKYRLIEKYENYLKQIKHKRVLGVLFRGTDYTQHKPFGLRVQPDLDTMLNVIRKKIEEWGGFDLIFLCTEVQQACDRFKIEFGDNVLYYPQLRFDMEADITRLALYSFGIPGERTKRGEDYWIALNILASCNSIIAGRCGGSDVALKINNNRYENVFLFDLGIYGIDD